MRSTLWTGIWLTLTALLASCGGSGSPPTTLNSNATTTCDSNTLWAALPNPWGLGIPDNNNTGTSLRWDNQNCSLRTVTSASLDICLDHPRPTDLTWTISPPGSSAPMALNPPTDWNTSGSSCGSATEKLQRLDLLPTMASLVSTRGNWTLNVKDQQLGLTGSLIQWRILIVGTP